MKVVRVDNFCRDTVDDVLVAAALSPAAAELMAKHKNEDEGPDSQHFYRAVEDDYVLQRWEP